MARTVGKLSALKVARLAEPGMYADGAGLYLQVTGAGAKSWLYRFSLHGRAREMGLGSLNAIPLVDPGRRRQRAGASAKGASTRSKQEGSNRRGHVSTLP